MWRVTESARGGGGRSRREASPGSAAFEAPARARSPVGEILSSVLPRRQLDSRSHEKPAIAYWIFNYLPEWEAASKEASTLFSQAQAAYDPSLFAMNTHRRKLRLTGKIRHLPLPWALAGLPMVRKVASAYRINHLFASAGERLLAPRLAGPGSILTVAKASASLGRIERNAETLERFRFIVTESERDRDLLSQLGLDEERIKLIYPGFRIMPYRAASGPFKILFATSPFGKYDLLARGVHLILRTARQMPDVEFVLVWREANVDRVRSLIGQFGVHNVEVMNGHVSRMGDVYASVHATIVPGLEHNSLKPTPFSAIESLAHGKPVLASVPTSVGRMVRRHACGVCFEPAVDDLVAAIDLLRRHYAHFRSACHAVIERKFSPAVYTKKYLSLYEAVLARRS